MQIVCLYIFVYIQYIFFGCILSTNNHGSVEKYPNLKETHLGDTSNFPTEKLHMLEAERLNW